MHRRSYYIHHLSSTASESKSVTQHLVICFSEDELIFTITGPDGGDRGSTVVKVLCYKLEGRCFDSVYNEQASRKFVSGCCKVYVAENSESSS